jgi:transposase
MYENQLSLFETAVRFGIPADSTVLSWDRAYRREGAAGLYRDNRKKMKQLKKPKPPSVHPDEALQRELEYLRAEVAYLKKLRVLVAARIARERGRKQPPSRG